MTIARSETGRCLALNLAAALIVVGLEIYYYPAVSTFAYSLAGGEGGPGSSMGYFRDRYIIPAGLIFAVLVTVSFVLSARKEHRLFHRVVVVVWALNCLAVLVSSLWYFHVIRAASGAGSP